MNRNHLISDRQKTISRRHDGCSFRSVVAPVVRTRCDQFLTNDVTPVVVIDAADEPSCIQCRDAIRRAAVAAAASAE